MKLIHIMNHDNQSLINSENYPEFPTNNLTSSKQSHDKETVSTDILPSNKLGF